MMKGNTIGVMGSFNMVVEEEPSLSEEDTGVNGNRTINVEPKPSDDSQ
jgi:hypothetical protein